MAPSSKPRRRQQATAPLIKGYLPVRLCLPTTDEGRSDDTFFYVKEHRDNNNNTTTSSTSTSNSTTTLFVANAPVIPPVSTKLLLKSIFGRYGDVTRVTVVPSPRHFKHADVPPSSADMVTSSSSVDEGIRWTDQFAAPSYFHHAAVLEEQEGRFAHVVFSSTKELKACLSSLHQVMATAQTKGDSKNAQTSKAGDSDSSSSDDDDDDDDDEGSHDNDNNNEEDNKPQIPGLVLDPIELQTLADETDRLYREEHRNNDDDSDADNDDDNKRRQQKTSRVLRVAERYGETCCTTSRDRKALLEECSRVMQQYDDEQARALAATMGGDGEPLVDDDGFVTVTYGNSAAGGAGAGVAGGSTGKRALDEAPVHEQGQKRREGQKRSRGSKKGPGASELADFYRFQTKENRKKTLHELREQFEQDLAKVQKMKQERQYRPF